MIRFPLRICLLILLGHILPSSGNSPEDFFLRYNINPSGIMQLRRGDYQKAQEALAADTTFTDTGFHFFKLALSFAGDQDTGKALFYLRKALGADSTLSPFIYTKIGELELKQKRYENSIVAFRSAVDTVIPPRFRQHLYAKMMEVADIITDSTGKIGWLDELVSTSSVISTDPRDDFDSFVADRKWQALDSLITHYLDTSIYRMQQCAICSSLTYTEEIPDTVLNTEKIYRLAKVANTCGYFDASSDWLHKALDRPDFEKVIQNKDYIFFRAHLNYNLTNYNKAIKWFDTYEKKFGPTPLLVYLVARSYRSLGQGTKASSWYDKHVRLYPHHYKSHDILWYRGWQREDGGNHKGARAFYRRIFKEHRGRKKEDDAYFRYALSYYKDAMESKDSQYYRKALQSFTDFLRRYSRSPLYQAALYWQAKCYLALNQKQESQEIYRRLSTQQPTDYYAYRARQQLHTFGDTTQAFRIDTSYNVERTLQWLDSLSRDARPLSSEDSLRLNIGRKLVVLGLTGIAEFYLEPLEMSYPKNLLLQFELASLYLMFDEPTLSYRIARKFDWRFSPQQKQSMPLPVYSLLYPGSFRNLIEPNAELCEINPDLVSAIMRQESIFDPQIVSPVGAVGLMQIMPYTGEEIAKDLQTDFAVDSLYKAPVNVRFGTHYIGKLLKQFDNDFTLAIASYNAGPHNVKKWQKINKNDDFDMFVEDIGFTETRGYVKKVLANYWTYQQLSKIQQALIAREFKPLHN
ncbi:MAG: transglycosylase SLT domain-containing protein [Chitinivibrionales bacterium]